MYFVNANEKQKGKDNFFFIPGRGWLGEAQWDGWAQAADDSSAGQGGGGAGVWGVWGLWPHSLPHVRGQHSQHQHVAWQRQAQVHHMRHLRPGQVLLVPIVTRELWTIELWKTKGK